MVGVASVLWAVPKAVGVAVLLTDHAPSWRPLPVHANHRVGGWGFPGPLPPDVFQLKKMEKKVNMLSADWLPGQPLPPIALPPPLPLPPPQHLEPFPPL